MHNDNLFSIFFVAPIAAALVNKYGCRVITTIGTLTAFTGFIASVFAKSVLQMYFTFGVMGGEVYLTTTGDL